MAQQMLTFNRTGGAVPIETGIQHVLKIEEVINYVEQFEDATRNDNPPFRPKGGEIYLFKSSGKITKNDWRADGHMWSNNGVKKLPKKEPVLTKSYFLLNLGQGKTTNKFKKEAYMCLTMIRYFYIIWGMRPKV